MVNDIYTHCPTYRTQNFLLRLVCPEDASSLLACYADPQARRFFNSDNCSYGFASSTLAQMQQCIAAWLEEYRCHCFVRFAIVSRQSGKAVGTVEMFHKPDLDEGERRYGLLRIDLLSAFEREEVLGELLSLILQEFPAAFGVTHLLTKAIPEAVERVHALKSGGFVPLQGKPALPYQDYWIKG